MKRATSGTSRAGGRATAARAAPAEPKAPPPPAPKAAAPPSTVGRLSARAPEGTPAVPPQDLPSRPR